MRQVLDMPLLFETHVHKMVGLVVVVSCTPEVQVRTDPSVGTAGQRCSISVSDVEFTQRQIEPDGRVDQSIHHCVDCGNTCSVCMPHLQL